MKGCFCRLEGRGGKDGVEGWVSIMSSSPRVARLGEAVDCKADDPRTGEVMFGLFDIDFGR